MRRLALILFLLLVPPASAEWSAPAPLGPATSGSVPSVAVAVSGRTMTTWTRGSSLVTSGDRTIVAGTDGSTGPVAYGPTRFALAYTRARQCRLELLMESSRRRIGTGRRILGTTLAANVDGHIAIAWYDDRGRENDDVLVSVRRPGGAFGRPIRLARELVRGVTVAVGARGDVVVAWNSDGKVRARFLGRAARRFGPVDTIRSEEAYSARLQAAVTMNGRAVVGWTAKFRSEGGAQHDTFVQAAVRPSAARRFRRAQLLHRSADAPDADGTLRLDGEGRSAAWTQPDGVFLAAADNGAVFEEPQRAAPAGANLEDLAGDLVVWSRDGVIHAGTDRISAPGEPASLADAALHPGSGIPTVVWVQDGQVMTSTRG